MKDHGSFYTKIQKSSAVQNESNNFYKSAYPSENVVDTMIHLHYNDNHFLVLFVFMYREHFL